jgi:hypothetical protein
MEDDPIAAERRRAYRRVRGYEKCLLCESTVNVEWHHVLAAANDEGLTVPLCRRHHDIVTEMQRTQGVDFRRDTDRSILESVGYGLLSIACFLVALAVTVVRQGKRLIALAADLDGHYPGWRSLPSAKAASEA